MMSTLTKTCGCGGSCGCGGGAHQGDCPDGAFKRPRFTPGMLLTDEALQSLVDYVVGKNRLHNRFLFGDGVVCGLSVTCHPCGEGKVTVAPGLAFDCCGNDIVLPCKEDLDIKALIRGLRKRQLQGYDCGDPCEDKDGNRRTYGLYLVYDETLQDPMLPYASPDPCGQQACEATAVCETYRFELRCDCAMPDRLDLFERIAACFGDLAQTATAVSKAQTGLRKARHYETALKAIRADYTPAFDAGSLAALREIEPQLAELKTLDAEAVDEAGKPRLAMSEEVFRRNLGRYQVLAGALTRFRSMPAAARETLLAENAELSGLVEAATATLADTGPRIKGYAPRVLSTPVSRIEAEETVRLVERHTLVTAEDETPPPLEKQMLAMGAPVSFAQIDRMRVDAMLLKDWLLDRLEASATRTRCDLYERARRVKIGGSEGMDEMTAIGASNDAIRDLAQILVEYAIDCICLALNPPCQPCKDPAVLLACLTVEDCEVIDICNMSRRFVLSPTAMRYWLPPIGLIGDLVEQLCCGFDAGRFFADRDETPIHEIDTPRAQSAMMRVETQPIVASLAPKITEAQIDDDARMVLDRLKLRPAAIADLSSLTSNLALLSVEAGTIDPVAVNSRISVLGDAVGELIRPRTRPDSAEAEALEDRVGRMVGEKVEAERMRTARVVAAELDSTVGSRVAVIRDDLRTELAETVRANLRSEVTEAVRGDLDLAVDSRLAEGVKTAVSREITAAKLRNAVAATKPIKDLQEENAALKQKIEALTAAVEELRGGTS
jgi:hypothetical protein